MQAQGPLLSDRNQDSTLLARLLIEANLHYQASNDPRASYSDRLQARQEARQRLQKVLKSAPANASALGLLGRVKMDEGDLDQARLHYEASIAADPDNAQLITNLGYWALATELPLEAERYFRRALAKDRHSAAAFCGIAHALRRRGQYDAAFLHYRRLLDLGLEWPSVYAGMAQCAEHLAVNQADQALALDAIRLLRKADVPHQNLARFVTAILRQQYDLDNPRSEVLLDAASQDELLLLALEKTLLCDPAVEELVTLLRQSITVEVAATLSLREALQPLAVALGIYARNLGYALLTTEEETAFVGDLNAVIAQTFAQSPSVEDLAGAIIVSAMYGALFRQRFSFNLGATEVSDWPTGMQALMTASYFDLAEEEDYKQGFAEKEQELTLCRDDMPLAWPVWSNLNWHTTGALREELAQSLAVEIPDAPARLRVLVLGSGSGQRALEIARYFEDVEVIAVEEGLANLAHATRRAREMALENIVFWPWSLANRFVNDGHQVHFVEIGQLPSSREQDVDINRMIRESLVRGGLVHLNTGQPNAMAEDDRVRALIESNRLEPSLENIRRLRESLLSAAAESPPPSQLRETDFYGTAGCRRHWFFPEDSRHLTGLLELMSSEVDWKLVSAQDEDSHDLATRPVLEQLRAQRLGSKVRSLVGHGLSLYFQRRR